MNISADNVKAVGIGAALLAVGYVAYQAISKGPQAVKDAAQAINPLNHDNVFASGVNSALGTLVSDTGPGKNADGSWTLGGWFFDVTHPSTAQAVKDMSGPVKQTAPAAPESGVQYDALGNVIGYYTPDPGFVGGIKDINGAWE